MPDGSPPLLTRRFVLVTLSALAYFIGLGALVLLRVLTGVGEAAVFVGAATAVQDLAPPSRRGEAASYFSVAVYGGLALGPALGEAVLDGAGSDAAWLVSAGGCLAAAVLGRWTPP